MRKSLKNLVADIESEVRYTRSMIGKEHLDRRVMQVMASTPRELFVPDHLKFQAFDNGPLPIGHSQTISQPYIVALMTDLLAIEPEHRVLEIGTGSGYQTAVLSQLCAQVYSIERIPELTEQAVHRFEQMHYKNIEARTANGYQGWSEQAPFDGIIVTAAASYIPESLVDQLKCGGKMVIPVGLPGMHQELMVVEKDLQGKTQTRAVLGVAFVPLIDDEVTAPDTSKKQE